MRNRRAVRPSEPSLGDPLPRRAIHDRIEQGFGRFGRTVVRHRWLAVGFTLALVAGFVAQLPPPFETAVEKFLRVDDRARIVYERFQEQFGRPDLVVVSVEPPEVFDAAFLERLRVLHEALEEEVPHVDEVQSLLNARSTRGREDELIVEDLIEEIPATPEEMAALRERALANPFYINTLLSEDARFTALMVTIDLYADDAAANDLLGFDAEDGAPIRAAPAREPLSGFEIHAVARRIQDVAKRFDAPDFRTRVAGSPILQQQVVTSMQREMPRFVLAMVAAVAVLLFLLFRRLSGVVLPLAAVLLSLAATVGAMAAAGAPITPPTQILPTFLLAVGVGTAVHVLKLFYRNFDAGESVEDAVAHALAHAGLAIVMTSATTAGGLVSFTVAGLSPIEDMGRFVPLGIAFVLLNCLVLLPAALAILPVRRRPPLPASSLTQRLERTIVRVGAASARQPGLVLGTTALLVAFSCLGIARLGFSNDVMSWLPDGHPFREATEQIDTSLKGSVTLELIVDSGREGGVKDPAFLKALDGLRASTGALRRGENLFVGRTISVADVVKEIHQALNENRADHYLVPDDPELVAQELLLFENSGSDDLEDLVDTPFRIARFTLKVPYVDPFEYDGFIEEAEGLFREALPDVVEVETTGFMGMLSTTMLRVIEGLARSYVLALAIITPLMIVLLGSLRTGLASMVPNLSPIVMTLGLMGAFDVPIDMFTMMIGSIALGLVVDDTIHFMHGFRRYYAKCGDAHQAIRETLETTGQALLFTSIVLSLGFSVFVLSDMQNLSYFGVFTSFAIVTAFLLDIGVSPALMVLATRRDSRRDASSA